MVAFALLLHAHQPAGNFEEVIEANYHSSYEPFLQAAAERPWLRLNLHFTGFLLDWLAERHPDYIERLRAMLEAGRLELLGGGYYEPILAAIPASDQQEQLARLADALERHFHIRPRGAWLAERVWEPELPLVLARAGLAYTMLDDSHLELAGLPAGQIHGYWLTESQSARVAVIPSNFFLRQALPFRPEREGLDFLAAAARQFPGSLLTMGDDLEKFGSWPHTFQHVYADGWLARFLDGLEALQDQVATVRLSDYIEHHPARGLVYIPSSSYPEMMRWADSAIWRGFLTKYPEANLLHKTQQALSRRLEAADAAADAAAPGAIAAHTHLLAAEGNDVYWHGWFGGLYSPHLRQLAFARLLAADQELEALAPSPAVERSDLLCTGSEVIALRNRELRLLISPGDGGTLLELDALAAHANLMNSIERRPEAYHDLLRRQAESNPAHLPGQNTSAAEQQVALLSRLAYDACAPAGARLYLASQPDTEAYDVLSAQAGGLELARGTIRKRFHLQGAALECVIDCPPTPSPVELEWIFNLLAPDAADRGLVHGGRRYRLNWEGELEAGALTLCDGWRRLHIELEAPGAGSWRVAARYTVSQSEQGFEALYQGSSVRAVWAAGNGQFVSRVKIFPCYCHF